MSLSISRHFFHSKTPKAGKADKKQIGVLFFFPDEPNVPTMLPAFPLSAGSCGEDHNESGPWVFLMNEPGSRWTATRAMCDLAHCCHGEAALLSPSRGALVLIIHT